MRIFALPLTKIHPNRPALVFYLTQLPPKPTIKEESRTAVLRKRITHKLVATWNDWGKLEKGWKKQTHDFGQRAQSRLDFEEIALRSIDPALGPHVTSSGEGAKQVEALKGDHSEPSISLIHPSSFRSWVGQSPLEHLESHLSERGPKHKRRFWAYILAIPLTIPFTVVPVIPNIPFFFVAWRAWSNYRAERAAEYLQTIIRANAITAKSSSKLDKIYRHSASILSSTSPTSSVASSVAPPSSSDKLSTSSSSPTQSWSSSNAFALPTEPDMLLCEQSIPLLVSTSSPTAFSPPVPEESGSELILALRQVWLRLGLEDVKKYKGRKVAGLDQAQQGSDESPEKAKKAIITSEME